MGPIRVLNTENPFVRWPAAALELLRAAAAGPCAACGAPRSAPLCVACAEASLVTTKAWRSEVEGGALLFSGSYRSFAGRVGLSPLGTALRKFKDQRNRHAGRCLGRILASTVPEAVEAADLVVAVPSDAARVRARGLAPACWLARTLAARLRVRFCADSLHRRSGHPPQRGLDGASRRLNAARAFGLGPSCVAGYRVVLVDDVVTTGATIAACSRLLREAGAVEITCAVVACADGNLIASCRSKTEPAGRRNIDAQPR